MELQLQQATKNFNMQTVREMISQEIQDTVESLEIEEMSREMERASLGRGELSGRGDPAERPSLGREQTEQQSLLGPAARFLRGSQSSDNDDEEEPLFFMGGAQEARFIIPTFESLGEMFVGIVPQTPGHIKQDDRIEEIIENVVEQKEEPDVPRQKLLRQELHVEPVQQVQEDRQQTICTIEESHEQFLFKKELVSEAVREAVSEEVLEAAVPEAVREEVPEAAVVPKAVREEVPESAVPEAAVVPEAVPEAVREEIPEAEGAAGLDAEVDKILSDNQEKPAKKGKRATKHNPTETPSKRTRRATKKTASEENEIDINDL